MRHFNFQTIKLSLIYYLKLSFLTFIPFLLNLAIGCAVLDWEKNSSLPEYRHYDIKKPGPRSGTSTDFKNSITLQWDSPKTNTDGTPLYDLAGYEVYYGKSRQYNNQPIDARGRTGLVIDNLPSGMWCFVAKAYDTVSKKSDFSEEICINVK